MNNQKENIEEELGDLFFTILNLTRHLKLDPDQTIRKANNKFIHRFNTMENILEQTNLKWHDLNKADFEELWNKAKSILKEDKNEF